MGKGLQGKTHEEWLKSYGLFSPEETEGRLWCPTALPTRGMEKQDPRKWPGPAPGGESAGCHEEVLHQRVVRHGRGCPGQWSHPQASS